MDKSLLSKSENTKVVRFYDPEFYALNPYSPHMVEWEGVIYPTIEHAYHSLRYPENKYKIMIIEARSPKLARDISQTLKEHQYTDWNEKKFQVMKDLMQAKAEQHEEVRDALKRSGDKAILKDIPEDSLWGIGVDGKGENIMGKIWEEIREKYI